MPKTRATYEIEIHGSGAVALTVDLDRNDQPIRFRYRKPSDPPHFGVAIGRTGMLFPIMCELWRLTLDHGSIRGVRKDPIPPGQAPLFEEAAP